MRRGDYEIVARVLGEQLADIDYEAGSEETAVAYRAITKVRDALCREFSSENPRFQTSTFMAAVQRHSFKS